MKAVFRQGFSKTFAKLSRKINLYNKLEHFSNSPIPSQNAQGPDIMGRTKERYKRHVCGVAMTFIPGKHAFEHWSRLYTYHIYINFCQIFSQQKHFISPFQEKTLAKHDHGIPQDLRKESPFHGPFAQHPIYIYIYIYRHTYTHPYHANKLMKWCTSPRKLMTSPRRVSSCASGFRPANRHLGNVNGSHDGFPCDDSCTYIYLPGTSILLQFQGTFQKRSYFMQIGEFTVMNGKNRRIRIFS